MLKFVSVVAGAALFAGAASAQTADTTADASTAPMASAPAYTSTDATNWTGPYVGIHGGYGFDAGDQVSNAGHTDNNITAINSGVRSSSINQNRSGMFGGGQIGYNLQRGNIVLGAEGDFSYMNSHSNGEYYGTDGRRTLVKSNLDWMGSARGRVGYVLGSGMFYGTGGYAFGRVKGRAEFDALDVNTVNYAGSHKYTAQGWTAGVGAEFRPFHEGMMSRVSLRLESNYYDLGRSHIEAGSVSDRPGYYTLGVDTKGYNAKFGINYAF